MDEKFPNGFPIPDEYLVELGRITALWGSLEAAVNMGIRKLSGMPKIDAWRVDILMAHSSFQQKVDIIQTLCEQLLPEYPGLKNYREAVTLVRSAQLLRNQYSHSGIAPDENGEIRSTRLQARGKLKITMELVKVSDLREVSRKTHLALLALHELITGEKYAPIWERQ